MNVAEEGGGGRYIGERAKEREIYEGKNEMVNTSKVKDVVNATVMAQIMNIDFINMV